MKLNQPCDVRTWAAKRYAAQCKHWLAGEVDSFPVSVPLCELTERDFQAHLDAVRQCYRAWRAWTGPGRVEYATWRWPGAGEHTLPARIHWDLPQELAAMAGRQDEWCRGVARTQDLQDLTGQRAQGFAPLYEILKSLPEEDWARLLDCVAYFLLHPTCGLYVRQLPIEGVDTKWVGAHEAELTRVLRLVHGRSGDFHDLTGVRPPEHLNHVMVRVLCPELRQRLAGLKTLDVPVAELAQWTLRPKQLLFVENLESGLALGDLPGTIAFVGKGNAVTTLASVDWIAQSPAWYWGDLDSHGLAIFARLRARMPQLQPVLMDARTLLASKTLWVAEPRPHPPVPGLPPEQSRLYAMLTRNGDGTAIRLEQERLPWASAWGTLQAKLGSATLYGGTPQPVLPCDIPLSQLPYS